MAGRLTTHVLDTAHGTPARGMRITLIDADDATLVDDRTNDDGRLSNPLLSGETMRAGRYTLHFSVGDYYRDLAVSLPRPPFLDEVPVVFAIASADQHYHVPLLVSPYGYTTYRGS